MHEDTMHVLIWEREKLYKLFMEGKKMPQPTSLYKEGKN